MQAAQAVREFPKNRVVCSLDEALVFAEDILIARDNPYLLNLSPQAHLLDVSLSEVQMTEADERKLAASFMENIVPMANTPELKDKIASFVSKCVRETFKAGDSIWMEGDESESAKILLSGTVCATLEGTKVSEVVAKGNIFGELGLVDGTRRLSTVTCQTDVVLYSLDKAQFEEMVAKNHPEARLLERIAVRYLAHRVQHVSNRIFETHCLPI